MKKLMTALMFGLGLFFATHVCAADVYTIDPVHSSVNFTIKHMMVSNVTGGFGAFEGTITFDPNDAASSKAQMTIQAASIDTHVAKRDEHLRGADFFDTANHPTITFVSKTITGSGGEYTITGDLTVKGITKEVSIPVEIAGPVADAKGGSMVGLSGQVVINRQDYGVSFNKALDNGGLALGNDVKVDINIEAKKE